MRTQQTFAGRGLSKEIKQTLLRNRGQVFLWEQWVPCSGNFILTQICAMGLCVWRGPCRWHSDWKPSELRRELDATPLTTGVEMACGAHDGLWFRGWNTGRSFGPDRTRPPRSPSCDAIWSWSARFSPGTHPARGRSYWWLMWPSAVNSSSTMPCSPGTDMLTGQLCPSSCGSVSQKKFIMSCHVLIFHQRRLLRHLTCHGRQWASGRWGQRGWHSYSLSCGQWVKKEATIRTDNNADGNETILFFRSLHPFLMRLF